MIYYPLFLSFILSHLLPFMAHAHTAHPILLQRCAFTELDCIDSTKPDLEKTFTPCIYTTLGTEGGDHPTHTSLNFTSNKTVAVALVGSKLYFKDQDTFWGLLNSLMPSCPEKTAFEYSRDGDVAMAPSTLFELIDAECSVTNLCQIYEDLNGVQPNATYFANTSYELSYDKFNPDYPYSFWMVFLPVDQNLVVNGSSANVMMECDFINNPVVYGKSMSKHVFWILIVVVVGYFVSTYGLLKEHVQKNVELVLKGY